jgi:KipI family sensor histidine kinase inhibitor
MSGVRLLPYGDTAVLVEVADLDVVLALHADLRARPPAGVVDVVPAERTVLVRVDPALTTVEALRADLADRRPAPHRPEDGALLTVPVVYDGDDLADVASVLGWTVDRLVAAHQERTWRVAFAGFAPGFGYLVPDGDWPEVPRRVDPRTSVPAGAVALAGRYAGVYPQATPGGWQLVGRTDLAVWDVNRDPPALMVPGTRVRFEAVP